MLNIALANSNVLLYCLFMVYLFVCLIRAVLLPDMPMNDKMVFVGMILFSMLAFTTLFVLLGGVRLWLW